MNLSELQLWFSGKVRLAPEIAIDGAENHIRGNSRLSANEQLAIYREQFWLRHEGSLEEDFRGLLRALSNDDFSALVAGFLTAHPPTSPSLAPLGERFPEFVRSALASRPDGAWLAELATLDWSFVSAFGAEDSASLDLAALASLPPEAWASASVEFAPSLSLHAFDYPVHELRRALLANEEEGEAPERRRTFLAIQRGRDFSLFDHELSEPAYRILLALRDGAPLLDACESVANASEEFRASIDGNLQKWFGDFASLGFFSRFVIAEAPPPE